MNPYGFIAFFSREVSLWRTCRARRVNLQIVCNLLVYRMNLAIGEFFFVPFYFCIDIIP